jgi:AcrR family transcriptional regulator
VQVFRGLPDLAGSLRPIALTIGNFDGVHLGHQAMLARLSEAAEDLNLPSAVLTFDPHPREFFAPGAAPPRLSTLRGKLEQFAAHGVDASLEKIARDAGVAIGTLYRHFPTRLDLLMAAFQPRLQEFLDGANKALEMNDPWEGFVYYLEHLFGMQAGDRGFNDFLSRRFTDSAETERIHDEMCQQIVDMLARAQEAGEARRDITLADIVNLIWSNGRIIEATSATAPNAWRRYLYLMLDAYRAERAHPNPEPPMTYEQLYDAMVHLSEAQ